MKARSVLIWKLKANLIAVTVSETDIEVERRKNCRFPGAKYGQLCQTKRSFCNDSGPQNNAKDVSDIVEF
jgi:hypothetical protein